MLRAKREKRKENRPREGYSPGGQSLNGSGPAELSDYQLVERAKLGSHQAVTELYTRYRLRVINHLYRFTGDRSLAEDLTQETFIRVVENLGRYKPTGSVAGWIYRIAGNLALNNIRRRKVAREVSLDEPVQFEDGSVERIDAIANQDPSPAERVNVKEMETQVQGALAKIFPRYREAVILCDIQGYAYKDAAELLDCSINTIASRVARGRAQLAKALGYLKRERP